MISLIKKKLFLHSRLQEHKKHPLSYLFWECTQRCNLSCQHCGSDCMVDSRHKDMPYQDFLKVLDSINRYPHPQTTVIITGGEPLLRKDLEECGYEIRKRGFRWGIVTNGYAYTPERHNSLLNAGMGAITVSFDGTPDSHNWLRNNPKSYEKALSAIRLLADNKRLNWDVVTCVNKRNIDELESIYTTLSDNKAKAWRLFTIAPIGRAKENAELLLNAAEFKRLMDFIQQKRKAEGLEVNFSCEGYVGQYEAKVRDGYFFCRAGIHIGSVLIDGSIGACPNIDRSFTQGNIYTDDFMDVWNERYNMYRDREWMRTGKCKLCKEFMYCQGNGMHYREANNDEPLMCHCELAHFR